MPGERRLIVWAAPGQEALIGDVVRHARLGLVAAGSPTRDGASALADALDVERLGDLRDAAQRDDADVLWLAAPAQIGTDERRLIREAGIPVMSSEPRSMALADVQRDPEEARTATFVPLLRRSCGYRASEEARREFGAVECVGVNVRSGAGEGSLFARLFDAMDLLDTLCGPTEGIDAALSGAGGIVPESVAALRGHLTVNVRFAGNRCAGIAASDGAGAWHRSVTLLGPGGCLRIDDAGYDWTAADSTPVEPAQTRDIPTASELVADQISRRLDGIDAHDAPPPDTAKVLALCEAARLSCRTGESETPERLLEMLSRP